MRSSEVVHGCGNRLLDREIEAVASRAVARMAEAGAIVEPVELNFVGLKPHSLVMLEAGVVGRVLPHFERFRDQLDPYLIETVEAGQRHGAVALQNAGAARSEMFRALQGLFTRYDVIVSPTLTTMPPPLDDRLPDGPVLVDGQPSGAIRGGFYPYTYPYNLTGHPALSIPCGRAANGLPIGLHLAGRWFEDEALLAVATLLETLLTDTWSAAALSPGLGRK